LSDNEPVIIKEFRELYDYVRLLGEHIKAIHNRLEKIENNINEISVNHSNFIRENTSEIVNIKENMVNKYELNDFIDKLKASVGEMFPLLPALASKQPSVEVSSNNTSQ
jgi:DNA anti-recombination protein RmuC